MDYTVFSKSDCLEHYQWGDDCHSWTFVETDAVSIKQELMPPNTSDKLHHHENATQFFFILSGRATVFIDGKTEVLKPKQGIEIPAKQKHQISNHDDADLEFVLYSHPSTKNDRIDA